MGLNHSQSAANKIYTTFLHDFILNSRLWLKSQWPNTRGEHNRGGAEMGRLHAALLDALQRRPRHATGISIATCADFTSTPVTN
jgi:hypothetical protein